jgi:disulfide bond formation protein DsbB
MDERRRILFHGFLMLTAAFALGLVAGVAGGQHHPYARLWLGAHLTGVLVGIMLVAVGLARPHIVLGPRSSAVFFWSLIGGNWLGFWILGIFSCSVGAGTPIVTPNLAPPTGWHAAVIGGALVLVSATTFVFCGLGVWGLRKRQAG